MSGLTKRIKLLAINFGGIGDEILFLPTLATIKGAHPDWHVTLLVEPRSRSVKDLTALVDDVVTFDIKKRPLLGSDLVDLIMLLKAGSYDVVVSSGSSPMVASLLFLSGIPRRIGYGTSALSRLLLTDPVPLNRMQYAARMYHDLVKGLSLPAGDQDIRPHITISGEALVAAELMLAVNTNTTYDGRLARVHDLHRVVIHPGTSKLALMKGLNKTWSPQEWVELIKLLLREKEIQVILSGGPDDAEAVAGILSLLPSDANVINTFGKTKSLLDLAALIDVSCLLVCVDSAPMHVACALGKRVVALFGPTDERKLLPEDPRFTALRKERLAATTPGAPSASPELPPPQASYLFPGAPSVQLQPDSVFRSVLDQLKAEQDQDSSPAVRGKGAPRRLQESLKDD